VLEELPNYSHQILFERGEFIENNKTKGNNKALLAYKSNLPTQLPQVAFSWTVGLILSDATLQRNTSQTNQTLRLKIQQANFNLSLLEVTLQLLEPYVFIISPVQNREMYSLTTISHEAFHVFGEIFQDPNIELTPNACVNKKIPQNIEDFLDETAIAAWFCGDGGREDYTPNQGRGILFHSQGFTLQCNERLAQALQKRYGWDVEVKFDYERDGQSFYCIKVRASSFNSFEKTIKPYILPAFLRKFPPPRSTNSRYLDDKV
jgi:hypothetical protein